MLDGYHWSINIINLLFLLATHSSISMNSPKAKSPIFRPQSFCIPLRFKVSKQSTSNWLVRLCASFQNQSRRRFTTFSCCLTKCFLAFSQLLEPFRFLDKLREAFLTSLRACFKNCGDCIENPSEQVKNVFNPQSNPAILPVSDLTSGKRPLSTTTIKNNSPKGVLFTVTVLTFPSID